MVCKFHGTWNPNQIIMTTWSLVAETAALRRDDVLFVKTLLVRPQSRAIGVPGSAAHVEYLYWTRLFDDVTFTCALVAYERNGRFHRLDGPAVISVDGYSCWYMHGKKHRIGGPVVERVREDLDGRVDKEWYVHGKRDREDGPAIESVDGHTEWWHHGERHRIGGPAVEHADGDKEWWTHGARTKVQSAK